VLIAIESSFKSKVLCGSCVIGQSWILSLIGYRFRIYVLWVICYAFRQTTGNSQL